MVGQTTFPSVNLSLSIIKRNQKRSLSMNYSLMDDSPGRLKMVPDHFQVSTSDEYTPQNITSSIQQPRIDNSSRIAQTVVSGLEEN
uniref:Uncharacterized protein n=1 Tax=Salix viminalis TaxID=40686 RepID=A0A6N2MGB9_SALVM